MSREPRVSKRAEDEIADTARRYSLSRHSVDREVLRDAAQAVRWAALRAEKLPEAAPHVRRVRLRRFPFALYFTVQSARVVVLALLPDPRPARWWYRSPAGDDVPPIDA